MWGETHSRSTNYRDTSAGFVSLFAAVGRGVLVLVVIGIVTATAMDTPALSHTHIAIWPYMGIPRENQRTRRQTFAYVALAFSDTDALTSHFFFVFAACTSYVMLEFHFCCNALGENCNILLRFLHRSPPPPSFMKVFFTLFSHGFFLDFTVLFCSIFWCACWQWLNRIEANCRLCCYDFNWRTNAESR